ncbi:hypothetical protein THRCLA_20597 [Thraustotheca clavata]|uniref:Uncharacterized protein n=1 Tax=Thraustotheca clavata TaxID=74557 RepID=A0A1W0A5H7_9STRA|nr:hypothetical protein THRCLA_20597 [Thraustotheca clavata]
MISLYIALGSGSAVYDGVLVVIYILAAIVGVLIIAALIFCYKKRCAEAELDALQGYHEVEDPERLLAHDTVCSRGPGIACDSVQSKVALRGIAPVPSQKSYAEAIKTPKTYAAVTKLGSGSIRGQVTSL